MNAGIISSLKCLYSVLQYILVLDIMDIGGIWVTDIRYVKAA